VECPFHQGRFDVRSGAAVGAPAIVPLQTFPVQVVDGRVFVRVLSDEAESLSETLPKPR
jgi:naphthalene 1,2-dioxygenase system ferredoxin subunit